MNKRDDTVLHSSRLWDFVLTLNDIHTSASTKVFLVSWTLSQGKLLRLVMASTKGEAEIDYLHLSFDDLLRDGVDSTPGRA